MERSGAECTGPFDPVGVVEKQLARLCRDYNEALQEGAGKGFEFILRKIAELQIEMLRQGARG